MLDTSSAERNETEQGQPVFCELNKSSVSYHYLIHTFSLVFSLPSTHPCHDSVPLQFDNHWVSSDKVQQSAAFINIRKQIQLLYTVCLWHCT